MRIVSVVGTRPQLIKAAALLPALRARHGDVFVDTGQHWDESLAGSFFEELGLPQPDHSLDAGAGSHAAQTAAMLLRLEPILTADRPDAVLVYGDTNSTLAGALAAAKLGLPVAHIEAGLRSFDRRMPEELNRVVVDHLSRWCFAPTPTAVANLRREGIVDGVWLVGDLMQDLAARTSEAIRDPAVLDEIAVGPRLAPGGYLFATIHRQENREPAAVAAWADLLGRVAAPDVVVVEPQGYRSSLALQLHAAAVITDSGGVQRESAWLGVPCVVLRESTEWLEAVAESAGRMVVVGLDAEAAVAALARLAPPTEAAAIARARAAAMRVAPAGAAEAIAAALDHP